MEPTVATSLDDLASAPVIVPVRKPDGTVLSVSMRPLSEAEHYAIRQKVKRPERTIKNFKSGGVPEYDDDKYARDLEENNEKLNTLVLLAMLPFDVPGTDDERIATLRGKMGQAIYLQLIQAAIKLNFVSEQEVADLAATFRPGREASPSGNGASQPDPESVAGAAAA